MQHLARISKKPLSFFQFLLNAGYVQGLGPGYRPTYGAATFTAGSTNAVFRLDRASDTTIHFNSCSFSNGINRLLYEGDTQNQHFHGYIAELIYYSGTISGTDLSLPRASQGR